jgi:SAM-dependent methyltransferase
MDAPSVRRVALGHGICPYYLGQDLQRWADVLVGDVHHLFDPNGQIWALSRALEWRLVALVDEAHNLVDRARDMHSASLSLATLHAAMARAPKALQPRLEAVAAELWRITRPGGQVIIAFSNRMFFTKAPLIWADSGDQEHLDYVAKVLTAQGWPSPERIAETTHAAGLAGLFGAKGDPFFAVIATKPA